MLLFLEVFSSIETLFHVVGHEGQHILDLVKTGQAPESNAYYWNRENDNKKPYFIPWPWIEPIPTG